MHRNRCDTVFFYAQAEILEAQWIRERVAEGRIVIPVNPNRKKQNMVGIGYGLRTKVNASIGTSSGIVDFDLEVRKAVVAEEEKVDTLRKRFVDHEHLKIKTSAPCAGTSVQWNVG